MIRTGLIGLLILIVDGTDVGSGSGCSCIGVLRAIEPRWLLRPGSGLINNDLHQLILHFKINQITVGHGGNWAEDATGTLTTTTGTTCCESCIVRFLS